MLGIQIRVNWFLSIAAAAALGFGSAPPARALSVFLQDNGYADKARSTDNTLKQPSASAVTSVAPTAATTTAVATNNVAPTNNVVATNAAAPAGASSTHPTATLYLSDGLHSLTLNNSSGAISFNGMLGKFSLNITAGLATGDALLPTLNVNSVSFGGAGTSIGTLTIRLSTTSLGTLPGSVLSTINGRTNLGSVSYSTFADSHNALFGNSTLLSKGGPFTSGPFAANSTTKYPVPGPFSVTEQFIISEGRRGSTSFGATITDPFTAPVTVPETGATALLLGLALLGMAFARRKFAVS
jgi:hypothetical protein